MPKRITIPAILIVIAAIIGFSLYTGALDGSTAESREEILNQKYVGSHIVTEEKIDGFVISGITTDVGEYGIAVFEPDGSKKYELQTAYLKNGVKTVIGKADINGTTYDLFWCNNPAAERAEITYTAGGKKEIIALDAKGNKILYHKAPDGNYTVNAVFYDIDGNVSK
ncbi:MAG: hypothetical protein ACI4SS_07350 [Clostridia bacterium]